MDHEYHTLLNATCQTVGDMKRVFEAFKALDKRFDVNNLTGIHINDKWVNVEVRMFKDGTYELALSEV